MGRLNCGFGVEAKPWDYNQGVPESGILTGN